MNLFGWEQKTFRRNAIFVMALLSLAMFMHEIFGQNGYLTLRREKKEYTDLQKQIQTLSQQNLELERKINALKNNPAAVEKQARDQLHLAKPGEIIYMLPGQNTAPHPETAQRTSPAPSQPQR
jgi:cell division protein FtsB